MNEYKKAIKIRASVESQVIDARKRLVRQRTAQTGAIATSYELCNQALTPALQFWWTWPARLVQLAGNMGGSNIYRHHELYSV